MQFTPLKDFYSEETRSSYCVGLSYFVKDDADHAKLAGLVPTWIKEGKVRLGPARPEDIAKHLPGYDAKESQPQQQAAVSGAGEVK